MTRAQKASLLGLIALVVAALWWHVRAPEPVTPAPRATPRTQTTSREHRAVARARPRPDLTRSPTAAGTGGAPGTCEERCDVPCEHRSDGRVLCPPPCESSGDCSAGEVCWPVLDHRAELAGYRCQGSTCSGLGLLDDCGPADTCVVYGGFDRKLYRCEPAGTRARGEPCLGDGHSEAASCQKGLRCTAGRCAPSWCDAPGDCPAGTRCEEVPGHSERTCRPACETDEDCGDGWRCLAGKHCVLASAPRTCVEMGCPAGQTCVEGAPFPWHAHASCLATCERDAQCPTDHWCAPYLDGNRYCEIDCSMSACPADRRCILDEGTGRMRCEHDLYGEIEQFFRDYEAAGSGQP